MSSRNSRSRQAKAETKVSSKAELETETEIVSSSSPQPKVSSSQPEVDPEIIAELEAKLRSELEAKLRSELRSELETKLENVAKLGKKPSPGVLVNFLNDYFSNIVLGDSEQSLRFRSVTDKISKDKSKNINSKPIIDLSQCLPLNTFTNLCLARQRKHPKTKLTRDELTEITSQIFDARLRGLLEIASVAVIKPPQTDKVPKQSKKESVPEGETKSVKVPKPPKENAFEKFVIPSLNLGNYKPRLISDYINVISSFLTDVDKLRTRVYNLTFPHALHDAKREAKGVNLVYLNRISQYHEEVLKHTISGDDEEQILSFVQSEFAKTYKPVIKSHNQQLSQSEIDSIRKSVALQLRNPEIVNVVLHPTVIETSKGSRPDPKWVKQITAIELGPNGKGFTQTRNSLSKYERIAIVELHKELHKVLAFVQLIRSASAANPNIDLEKCYSRYNKIMNEIQTFVHDHEPETYTNETFIRYFLETLMFLKDRFGYKTESVTVDGKVRNKTSPLKCFIAEVYTEYPIKFNKNIRTMINAIVDGKDKFDDEHVNAIVRDFDKSWDVFSNPKLYNVNKLDIYSKLGEFVPVIIGKQYRVAIGIMIIQFLIDQVNHQRDLNRKRKNMVIYVKA